MSFQDYMHEKAEESRHNETLAYLMFLTGAIFFVGGILETLSLGGEPEWFLLIPYRTQPTMATYLGLTLVIVGISMLIAGITFSINQSRDRGWYMQELHKTNASEESKVHKNSRKNGDKGKKGKLTSV